MPSLRLPRKPLPYYLAGFLLGVTLSRLAELVGLRLIEQLAEVLTTAFALLIVGTLFLRFLRRFLWRVGRRLAFSYFLIGVLPIPMVGLLALLVTGMMSGFFMGHLYRDAVEEARRDLVAAATHRLEAPAARPAGDAAAVALADYRGGRRIGADERFPATWPEWIESGNPPAYDTDRAKEAVPPYVALEDGQPALVGAAGDADRGVVALFTGDLQQDLSERADVWVQLRRSDDESASKVRIQIGSVELPLGQGGQAGTGAASGDAFFARRRRGQSWIDRPLIRWGEISRPYLALADGSPVAEHVVATLTASPRLVHRHLFSSDAEINTAAGAATLAVAFLLFDVYAAAVLMAAFLSFGLTRAVNRLSGATAAVGRGDFAVRIPVRRKDQVGDLQRSFNQMTSHLQELVATAAQKEALDAELEIARRLQKSLLPSTGPATVPDHLEFSTHFEPSAAIGGDYFDILPMSDGRLAVIIADVSGHGLPAGLRMAMLKAALQLLVEDRRPAAEILRRLDAVVRSAEGARSFVTATLTIIDPEDGAVEMINAGHPPTYRLSADGGAVEEILLPGSALGGLGTEHARTSFRLGPGETLVWLSDGLIEAPDEAGEPFGYERIVTALRAGPEGAGLPGDQRGDAHSTRDRLLAAVRSHSASSVGRVIDDDRTVVVLRYLG